MSKTHYNWAARFDHILVQIEYGRMEHAVAILSGMLDAIAGVPHHRANCRAALLRHPLYAAMASPLAQPAIARLGFYQGLEARRQLFEDAICTNQKAGRSICIFRTGKTPPRKKYDVIVAPELADHCCMATLGQHIQRLAHHIKADGRILLSAFTPNHLGLGWRRIFLGDDLSCHDETSVRKIAQRSGYSAAIFQDASGNLIWAELCRAENDQNRGL